MEDNKPKEQNFVDAPAEVQAPAFGLEKVLQMLADTQQQLVESNKKLAESIAESRKPYIDPRVLEEKQELLRQRQQEVKLEILRRKETKKQCHHHRVDDQDNPQPKLNIKWMRHSNGIILGVCGRCMSQFDATHNPEDAKLLRQDPTALNQMGRARS